jgi:hypothetical protein
MATQEKEKKEIQEQHQRLLANLKLIQRNFGVKRLCSLLDISKNTWISRMHEPWARFSYDNLRSIARYTEVDFITLVDGELKLM